jgi:hypothetical protein
MGFTAGEASMSINQKRTLEAAAALVELLPLSFAVEPKTADADCRHTPHGSGST